MMGRVCNILIVTLMSLLFAVSCTKKRSDQFAQGNGNYLQTYAKLDGKSFVLNTGATISETATTASEKIIVEGQVPEGIRILPLVEYSTNADLLGEIPFRGRPNHKYEIRYKLDKRYLRVEKVAPEQDIPTDEMTYAEKLEDGRYAVPLVGYNVSYYHLEKRRNSDNEDTHEWIQVEDLEPTRASHVKFSRLDRVVFQAVEKIDVFPSSYFLVNETDEDKKRTAGERYWDGEWYFSETVVSTTENSGNMVGDTSGVNDASFNPASKIRFEKDKDQLRGVNINIDERLKEIKKDDRLNYTPVISIPVEWKAFRIALDGSGDALKEEDRTEISWDQRGYMAIKFEETRTVIESLETYLINLSGGKKLIDLRFAEDYFSYALLDIDSGKIVRYSFLKAHRQENNPLAYEPRTYRSVTRKDYGFFTSAWNQIYNYELYTQEDVEKHTYLNRFNPKKEIVFYITDNSPDDALYTRVTEKAVEYWDKAFKLAGAKTNIRFDSSKRVNLADLRYNAINYIDGVSSGSGLLGFGPSLSDPFTGEIIMATSNMHVANFRSLIVSQLRLYIRQELGYFDAALASRPDVVTDSFTGYSQDLSMSNPLNYRFQIDENGNVKDLEFLVQDYLSRDGYRKVSFNNFSPESQFSRLLSYVEKKPAPKTALELSQRYLKVAQERPALVAFASHADRDKFSTIMSSNIEKKCPELKVFAASVASTGAHLTTDEELRAMDSCIKIFLEEKLLATLVHEMGHNFGLAHNFRASTDKNNFWSAEEMEEYFNLNAEEEGGIPHSASTMDYIPMEHDRLLTPGKYDIAALHFGYVDDKKNNPIQINIPSQPFYCDDIDYIYGQDALCMQHDYGTTPLEIVENDIRSIEENMAVYRYRFDRAAAPQSAGMSMSKMLRIRIMYDHWRFKLKDFVGSKAGYLQGLYNPWSASTGADYKRRVLDPMSQSAFKKDYEEFFPVRDRIYNFLKEMALLPDAVCMYNDSDNEAQWVPLTTIREDVKAQVGRDASVRSCNDDVVKNIISEVYKGEYVQQIGQPVSDYYFSLNVEDIRYSQADVVGVYNERSFAGSMLGTRIVTPTSYLLVTLGHVDSNLFPSVLDEPDLREDFTNEVLARMLFGADLKPYAPDLASMEGNMFAETYSNDSAIVSHLYRMLLSSAYVPESSSEYSTRITPMLSKSYRSEAEANADGVKSILRVNGMIIGAREENTYVRYLMNEYESAQFRAENIEAIMAERDNIMTVGNNIIASIPASTPLGGGVQTVDQFRRFGSTLAAAVQQYGERSMVGRLIQYMFGLELTVYVNALMPMDNNLKTLKAQAVTLQGLLDSGLDTDGSALTPEREAAIKAELKAATDGVTALESLVGGSTSFAAYFEYVNTQLAQGALPPVQALQRQPVASRFVNLTKKGLAHELDAKRTLLLNTITSGVQ